MSLSRALNRVDPAGCSALMHACCPCPPPDCPDDEDGNEGKLDVKESKLENEEDQKS